MTTLNKISGFVVGQYGSPVELQVVDDDGRAVDISAYTGIVVTMVSGDGKTSLDFAGSFSDTGTDGKILFTPTSNNTFDRKGTWNGQIELTAASTLSMTVPFEVIVEPRLGS